jgi:hypothetical protein
MSDSENAAMDAYSRVADLAVLRARGCTRARWST